MMACQIVRSLQKVFLRSSFTSDSSRSLESAFVSLFLLAGVFSVLPKQKMIDAADLATTERFAKAYTQTAFDNPSPENTITLSGLRQCRL